MSQHIIFYDEQLLVTDGIYALVEANGLEVPLVLSIKVNHLLSVYQLRKFLLFK